MPGEHTDRDVVLVHGWGGSFAATWESSGFTLLLEEAGWNVIGVDLLGHGSAPKPHDSAAYVELWARVRDVLPAHPVAAIGFSMGALTLLRLACNEPELFDRLLLAGIGDNSFDVDPAHHAAIIRALEAPVHSMDELDPVGRLFRQYAEQPGNDIAALTAVMRRPTSEVITDAELARVSCPVRIVVGDRDVAGPADGFAARFPNASVTTLRHVDHFATTEAFGFVDAALNFLE